MIEDEGKHERRGDSEHEHNHEEEGDDDSDGSHEDHSHCNDSEGGSCDTTSTGEGASKKTKTKKTCCGGGGCGGDTGKESACGGNCGCPPGECKLKVAEEGKVENINGNGIAVAAVTKRKFDLQEIIIISALIPLNILFFYLLAKVVLQNLS